MNDYLKSISNLEKDITESKVESLDNPDNIEGTPIVSAPLTPPLITDADTIGVPNHNNEVPAEYLTPRTIIVRKYRLKK